jgi:hypothetical protein
MYITTKLTKYYNISTKYYYAGGSMRSMLRGIDEVKKYIDRKFQKVADYKIFFHAQFGESSATAVNSLTQTFKGKSIPVSKYVTNLLAEAYGLEFLNAAERVMTDNPSWQGWVFELRIISQQTVIIS